jgi:hypothetical protein
MAIVLFLIGTALLFSLQTAGADDAVSVDEAADLAQDLTNPLPSGRRLEPDFADDCAGD